MEKCISKCRTLRGKSWISRMFCSMIVRKSSKLSFTSVSCYWENKERKTNCYKKYISLSFHPLLASVCYSLNIGGKQLRASLSDSLRRCSRNFKIRVLDSAVVSVLYRQFDRLLLQIHARAKIWRCLFHLRPLADSAIMSTLSILLLLPPPPL